MCEPGTILLVASEEDHRLGEAPHIDRHGLGDDQVHQRVVDQVTRCDQARKSRHVRRDAHPGLAVHHRLFVPIPVRRDNRHAARHRLDRREPKRLLRVVTRRDKHIRGAVEMALLFVRDISQERHAILQASCLYQEPYPLRVCAMGVRARQDKAPPGPERFARTGERFDQRPKVELVDDGKPAEAKDMPFSGA